MAQRKNLIILFAISLQLISLITYAQDKYQAKIYGTVVSEWTGEPLIGVNVYVESQQKGTITDVFGQYELTLLKGTYEITFSRVDLKKVSINRDITEDTELNQSLKEETLNLNEITIYGDKPDEHIKSLDVGKTTLSIERIMETPSFMGEVDVIKSLILLPGVSTVGEGASGFNVRGGGVDQNLILQDGGLIFNPSHFFGFFSVFNPSMVDNATLYKSGVPAQYGGRLSSVLDVKLKDGNFREYDVEGGIGLVSSKLTVSGPILQNKLSFIAGGRASYSDWLLQRAEDVNLRKSSAKFQDFNAKLTFIPNEKDMFSYSGYYSNDGFNFASDTIFNWQTQNHVISWNHGFSNSLYLDTKAAVGSYQYNIENLSDLNTFSINSAISYQNLELLVSKNFSEESSLNMGGQSYFYQFQPGKQQPLGPGSNVLQKQVEEEKSVELAAFVEYEQSISTRLSFKAGLRYSYFANLGEGSDFLYGPDDSHNSGNITDTVFYTPGEIIVSYGGIEPRTTINFSINEKSSLKVSYNRTRQYLHLISNTAASTPSDFWKTSNKYIAPEIGDQYAIGYFRNYKNNSIETSVEAYFKTSKNIVDYKDGVVLLMNENIEADLIYGTAEAYGIEFFANKKYGKWTGWFGYTFSRTFRQVDGLFEDEKINHGEKYPANYDKPHDLTISTTYNQSPILSYGINFTYSTGRPATVPLSLYKVSNLSGVSNYSLRNQERIPDYHRLDLSMTLKSKPRTNRKWRTSWTFAVYNVYSRDNAYSIFFRNNMGEPPKAYKLSVLGNAFPSVMFNFEF